MVQMKFVTEVLHGIIVYMMIEVEFSVKEKA